MHAIKKFDKVQAVAVLNTRWLTMSHTSPVRVNLIDW